MVYRNAMRSVIVENSSTNILLTLVFLPLSQRKASADRGLIIINGGELAGAENVGAQEVCSVGKVLGVFGVHGLLTGFSRLACSAEERGAPADTGGAVGEAG